MTRSAGTDDRRAANADGPGTARTVPECPLASREEPATRRFPPEDRGRRLQYRGAFERDRDRIIHSRAFRRLSGKTQLLPGAEALQVRHRMTHTLEVASAARVLARHLGLNEDLAEAVALAHDLGQPPYGVAGTRALQRFLEEGFHPRAQSLRVVDLLEVRYAHPGLNLTDDARDGILKLRGEGAEVPPGIDPAGLSPGGPPSLEAQAVRAAIGAITPLHDLEDALSEGVLALEPVLRLAAVHRLVERLKAARAWPRGRFRERAALHRALTHAALSDVLLASRRRLAVAVAAGRIPAGRPVIAPGARGTALLDEVQELVDTRVVGTPSVRRADARGEQLVSTLLTAYSRDPRLVDDAVLLRYKEISGRPFLRDLPSLRQEAEIREHYHGQRAFARLVADHVAGMTDRFARDAHEALVPGRSPR